MYAAVMHEFGGPSVLSLESVSFPASPKGWVNVRLDASALNWHDVLVRRGAYGSPLPHVPGTDGVGVRTDTDEDVIILPSLFWGEREAASSHDWELLGDHRFGTNAEYVSVPAECVIPRPSGYNLEQSAALGLAGLTTYRALFSKGRLQPGESLLVLGASGGVATTAVALAAALGVNVVVTSAAASKVAAARELGAADGVDHSSPEWVNDAKALTPGGDGFDLVLDSVGRWSESIDCLRPGGRCVVLGASAAAEATLGIRPYYFGQYELIGTTMGSPRDMQGLLMFLDEHRVPPPVIDQTFPLAEIAAAHERLESGVGFGKVVLHHR